MSSHRYWRALNISCYASRALALSEFVLCNGTTPVAATPTANITPATGSLSDLSDGLTSAVVTWADTYGLVLSWDLGSATEVNNIQLGSGASQAQFPLSLALQWSDDGTAWAEHDVYAGISWPSASALTAHGSNAKRFDRVLNMEGLAGSTPERDLTDAPLVAAGTAPTLTTAQAKFGTSSLAGFTAGTLRLPVRPSSTTEDFFVAVNFRWDGSNGSSPRTIWSFGASGYAVGLVANTNALVLYHPVSGNVVVNFNVGVPNTWHLVVVERVAGVITVTLDGVVVGSSSSAGAAHAITDNLILGSFGAPTAVQPWYGHLDNVAVMVGRNFFGGSAFTPPSAAWESGHRIATNRVQGPAAPQGTLFAPSAGAAAPYSGGLYESPPRALRNFLVDRDAGTISGTVKEKNLPENTPLRRRVRLYRESDGLLVQETWSDATTGAYIFYRVDTIDTYTVLSYDHMHNYRAAVADNLTPT